MGTLEGARHCYILNRHVGCIDWHVVANMIRPGDGVIPADQAADIIKYQQAASFSSWIKF